MSEGPSPRADGWVSAVLDDAGLDTFAFRAYLAIARRGGANGECWESIARMAERCQMSTSRLQRALRVLERRGLIERVERAGETSVYRKLTPTLERCGADQPAVPATVPTTPVPGTEVPTTPVPGTDHPGTRYRPPRYQVPTTPVPGTDKGLALEGLALEGLPRKEWGPPATAALSPPAERGQPASAKTSQSPKGQALDIDEAPPAYEAARGTLDPDPRLTPEASLMSHLTGNGSLIRGAHEARGFFQRLLGKDNAKHPQVEPRRLDWYRIYGTEFIEAIWREALTAQHPKHARKTPLYYLIDALDGKFTPNAAAARDAKKRQPRELRTDLTEGEPVLLPDGTTAILDSLDPIWAKLEGRAAPIRPEHLRPVGRASS